MAHLPPSSAWILGAGPGIGRAAAQRFAQAGYRCGVVARPGDDLALEHPTVHADLFEPQALTQALADLEIQVGLPSILVYNASCGTQGSLMDLPPEASTAQLAAATHSLLTCVAKVVPAMAAVGRGTLLVTGGGLAFEPKPGLARPSAIKALQRSLTLSLAEELAPRGIHVATLAVCGFVQPGSPLSPEAVAEALFRLHLESPDAWQREVRIP